MGVPHLIKFDARGVQIGAVCLFWLGLARLESEAWQGLFTVVVSRAVKVPFNQENEGQWRPFERGGNDFACTHTLTVLQVYN